MISAYRYLGHRQADIDPLSATSRPDIPELNPEFHGLSHKDMDIEFETGSIGGIKKAPLREILNMLAVTYCGTIWFRILNILLRQNRKTGYKSVLKNFIFHPVYLIKRRRRILDILIAAKELEVYLHKKYVGQNVFPRRWVNIDSYHRRNYQTMRLSSTLKKSSWEWRTGAV